VKIDLDKAFEAIELAMQQAAAQYSVTAASVEAQRQGLVELGDGKPSQITVWELRAEDRTLRFRYRWYDQSRAFSIQPDMNVLSLELSQEDKILRSSERRYEDKF